MLQCPQEHRDSVLVSVDPASGQVSPLGDMHDADYGIWSRTEGDRGWLVYEEDGCERIVPAAGHRVGKMPHLEPAALLPWAGDADCTARGRIGFPEPEPTMDRILVLASPESAGVAPDARKSLPWHLYEVDAAAGRIRRIGGDFVQPDGFAVVAGGAAVVADATALRTVDLATGKVSLLAEGNFSAPAAAPDGRSIAVTEYPARGFYRILINSVVGG
jgi:hypothetical protein